MIPEFAKIILNNTQLRGFFMKYPTFNLDDIPLMVDLSPDHLLKYWIDQFIQNHLVNWIEKMLPSIIRANRLNIVEYIYSYTSFKLMIFSNALVQGNIYVLDAIIKQDSDKYLLSVLSALVIDKFPIPINLLKDFVNPVPERSWTWIYKKYPHLSMYDKQELLTKIIWINKAKTQSDINSIGDFG